MDAIAYLTDQHRELASLFDQIETAARARTKQRLCRKLVDLLAVHAAVEEMIFYPAAPGPVVEDVLPRAFEEHRHMERLVADLVRLGALGTAAAANLAVLGEHQRRHAAAEERELFPRVKELLTPEQLDVLGDRLASVAEQLMGPGAGARERVTARRAVA